MDLVDWHIKRKKNKIKELKREISFEYRYNFISENTWLEGLILVHEVLKFKHIRYFLIN